MLFSLLYFIYSSLAVLTNLILRNFLTNRNAIHFFDAFIGVCYFRVYLSFSDYVDFISRCLSTFT